MFILSLALVLAPQTAFLPLASAAGENDGSSPACFTPSGRALVSSHGSPGTLTHLSFAAGAVTASGSFGGPTTAPRAIAPLPNGSAVLLASSMDNTLSMSSVPSMVEVASLRLGLPETGRLDVARAGTFAVVSSYHCGQERSSVVDLASFTVASTFTWPANPLCDAAVGLAQDDLTFVVPAEGAIVGIDVRTGLESGRTALSAPGTIVGFALSEDRSRAIVLTTTAVASSAGPAFVEVFDLPALTSLGARPIGTVLIDAWRQPVVDGAGTRALVFGDVTSALDVATGALVPIAPRPWIFGDASLTGDGARALFVIGAEARVFDAATGALVAVLPLRERERSRVVRSPDGTTFAVLGDRIELIDLAGPTPRVRLDASSGLAPEWDGPFVSLGLPSGERALVAGASSDDLHLVDLTGDMADLGRVVLDAEPRAIALRSDGAALVAHKAGASLSVVDVATLTEVARWPLPAPALAVAPLPSGSEAWLYTEDLDRRRLVHIDTASGVVLATVALEGAGSLPAPGAAGRSRTTVVFDLPRGRAFVVRPATGIVEMVDLPLGAVVAAVPLPTVGQPFALAVTPDGSRLFQSAGDGTVRAFDVSVAALAPRWTYVCAAVSNFTRPAQISLLDGGGTLLVTLARPVFGSSACPWHVLLDSTTGGLLSAFPFAGPLSSVEAHHAVGGHLFAYVPAGGPDHGVALEQFRRSGATLAPAGGPYPIGQHFGPGPSAPMLSAASGIVHSIVGDVLARIDLVDDTRACSPSTPNGVGNSVALEAAGTGLAGDGLHLRATGFEPNGMVGYLLSAPLLTAPFPVAGGVGFLCLGSPIQRLVSTAQAADAAGVQRFLVDTGAIATPLGPVALQPGDSWCFQTWYRDRIGSTATSNTSDALRVTLR